MSQYFLLFNEDKKEYVSLPGMAQPISRLTNSIAMGMVGFLLLDGPQDGTNFSSFNADDISDEAIDAFIRKEKASEHNTYRRYVTERPGYIDNQFERKHGYEPSVNDDVFKRFCSKKANSTYRNDDASWNRDKVARIVASGQAIAEANEYAGRWAGDSVSLTGDYAESDLYNDRYGRVVARESSGALVSWRADHPRHVEQLGTSPSGVGTRYRDHQRDAEPGETIKARSSADTDEEIVEFVRYEPNEWTDITDGVLEEFQAFVGPEWLEENDASEILSPDMVLTA